MKDPPLFNGSLGSIILKLLEENGRMYGYEITQKVKALTNGEVVLNEGALYPALHKLESDGCLTAEIENSGNRLRKYYAITPKGHHETVRRLSALQEFLTQLHTALSLSHST